MAVGESYRVIMAPEAIDDLDRILRYIAQDSVAAATKVVERVIKDIEGLGHLPRRFAVARGSRRLPYEVRSMPIPPFRVLYRVLDEQRVMRVLTVRHGRQRDWPEGRR